MEMYIFLLSMFGLFIVMIGDQMSLKADAYPVRCRTCKKLQTAKWFVIDKNGHVRSACKKCRDAAKTDDDRLFDQMRLKP